MKKMIQRLLTLLAVLTLVPFAALAEAAPTATTPAETTQTETAPAETNADGMPYILSYFADTPLDVTQYEGKALFLNFFTGWCHYCMQEMPEIKEIYDTYDPDQVAIILIHVWDGEDASDSAQVVSKYGLENMILLEDDQLTLTNLIGLSGFPTSLFIDQQGYVKSYQPTALDFDTMSQILDSMGIAKRADTEGTAQ